MPGPRPATADFDYKRYLASREWALLKEQVRERCHGRCEHCLAAPYEETHHTTYARIGHESLDDLMAVCRPCHAFLSGKEALNPLVEAWLISEPLTTAGGKRYHLILPTMAGRDIRPIGYHKCSPHRLLGECILCKYEEEWVCLHDFLGTAEMWQEPR